MDVNSFNSDFGSVNYDVYNSSPDKAKKSLKNDYESISKKVTDYFKSSSFKKFLKKPIAEENMKCLEAKEIKVLDENDISVLTEPTVKNLNRKSFSKRLATITCLFFSSNSAEQTKGKGLEEGPVFRPTFYNRRGVFNKSQLHFKENIESKQKNAGLSSSYKNLTKGSDKYRKG